MRSLLTLTIFLALSTSALAAQQVSIKSMVVPPKAVSMAIADCPPGTTLETGGFNLSSSSLRVFISQPYTNGKGTIAAPYQSWLVAVRSLSQKTLKFKVYALCASEWEK